MWPQLITFTHLLEGCGVFEPSSELPAVVVSLALSSQRLRGINTRATNPPPRSTLNQAGCNWCESVSLEA